MRRSVLVIRESVDSLCIDLYAVLVYGILRKCGSASATPSGGKYMCAHTLLKTPALSCKFTKLGNLNTCSDRWLITGVLSAEQTVLVRKKASVSTVSLQLDKG